ncbi:sigma 54-interacting transcriptional regulator [Sorangium sp. So ce281]|uniref:sigma 54-interacting transcriptional regulator n=1 Tax=unclassified Sorangium TaxID=2621164 RepID=UPI003F61B443
MVIEPVMRSAAMRELGRIRRTVAPKEVGISLVGEIGEMPISVQAKLLRFLENRKFMRVGGTEKLSVNARIVCATLRPLEQPALESGNRSRAAERLGISLRTIQRHLAAAGPIARAAPTPANTAPRRASAREAPGAGSAAQSSGNCSAIQASQPGGTRVASR